MGEQVMKGGRLNGLLSLFLAVLLVVSLVPVIPTAYADEPSNEGSSASDEGSTSVDVVDEGIDITSEWSAGSLVIDEAGSYYLSDDIQTTGTLYLNAPEGETITLDFSGYTVQINGTVMAGIDASSSKGQVVIVDSGRAQRIEDTDESNDDTQDIDASLTVDAVGVTGAVAGILFNPTSEDAQTAQLSLESLGVAVNLNTLDVSEAEEGTHDAYALYVGVADSSDSEIPQVDVFVDSCAFQATVGAVELSEEDQEKLQSEYGERLLESDEYGIACGIFSAAQGVQIAGTYQSAFASEGGSCDLYAAVDQAFILDQSFDPQNTCSFALAADADSEYVAVFAEAAPSQEAIDACIAADANFSAIVDNTGIALLEIQDESSESDQQAQELASDFDASTSDDASAVSSEGSAEEVRTENEEETAADATPSLVSLFIASIEEGLAALLNNTAVTLSDSEVTEWDSTTATTSISESGTYCLTENVTLASLAISADDVTLNLNGHTLTLTGFRTSSPYSALYITGDNFTLMGGNEGSGGTLKVESSNTSRNSIIYSIYDASSTGFSASNIKIDIKPVSNKGSYPAVYGIYVRSSGASVSLNNVSLAVDQSDMTVSATNSSRSGAYGIYLYATEATLEAENCTITTYAKANSSTSSSAVPQVAYGVYANSSNTVSLSNTSVSAQSEAADAVALYSGSGANFTLDGCTLSASAVTGYTSYGIQLVNAEDSVVLQGSTSIDADIGLSLVAEKQIAIGQTFALSEAASSIPVLLTVSNAENKDGNYFASYEDSFTPTEAQYTSLAAAFANAASTNSNIVSADANGICFVTDTDNPVASINGTPYGSLSSALSSVQSGDTIMLESAFNGGAIVIDSSVGDADTSFTIDVNSNDVEYISNSSSSSILIQNSVGDRTFDLTGTDSSSSSIIYNTVGVLSVYGAIADLDVSALTYAAYNTADLVLENCDFSLTGTGTVFLYGVYNAGTASNQASVTLDDCNVKITNSYFCASYYGYSYSTAEINGGTYTTYMPTTSLYYAYGVYVASTATATLNNAEIKVQSDACTATSSNKYVAGIYSLATSQSYKVALNACSVDVSAAEDYGDSVYSFYANASAADRILLLDGECAFSSPLYMQGSTLEIGENFSLDSSSVITLVTTLGSGDTFAYAAEGVNDLSSAASYFVGSNSSGALSSEVYHKGLVDADVTKLWWSSNVQAKVGETDYYSLRAAIEAAVSGETIELSSDVDVSTLEIDKPITLNLAGNTLTINAGKGIQVVAGTVVTTGAGIVYSGEGVLKITDSGESKGSLDISIGSQSGEIARLNWYAGIAVTGSGSSLVIDDATVSVEYTGQQGSAAPSFSLYGVLSYPGDVSLEDSAVLDVRADSTDSATLSLINQLDSVLSLLSDESIITSSTDVWGPSETYGIYSMPLDGETGDVLVESDATVSVRSNVAGTSAGYYYNANTSTSGDRALSALREISPDEDSDLYKEIEQKFKENASYDAETGIYYAAPLTLDDGTYVFAYSAKVEGSAIGTSEAIKPAKMYVYSTYTVPALAVGIGASSTAKGTCTVQGTIKVDSETAATSAVYANGAGDWTIAGATLHATSGDGIVRQASRSINLDDELDLGTGNQVFFPENRTASLVEDLLLPAYGIQADSGFEGTVTLSGAVSFDVGSDDSTADDSLQADISVPVFYIAESFEVSEESPDSPLSVSVPDGNELGVVFAQATDEYEISEAQRQMFADADAIFSPEFADEDGVSVLVWEGGYEVKLVANSETLASYEGLLLGDSIALPDAATLMRQDTDTTTYTFLGWSTDPDATEIDEERGDVSADATTLEVTQSAIYYAIYLETPITRTWTISGAYDNEGNELEDVTLTTEFGQTLAEALNANGISSMPAAQNYTDEKGTHYFIGWILESYPQKSAINAYSKAMAFDPQTIGEDLVFDQYVGGSTIKAQYVTVSEGQALVTFKVDYMLVAYALNTGDQPTYAQALSAWGYSNTASAPSKIDAADGTTYTFEGWKSGYLSSSEASDDDALLSISQIPAVTADDEQVTYTAAFSSEKTTVDISIRAYYYDSESESWSSATRIYAVDYGTDLNGDFETSKASSSVASGTSVDLSKLITSFTQDGTRYEFKGFSIRSTDKDAVWEFGDLPEATSDVTYYAVYEESEQLVDVTFMAKTLQDDGSYAYTQWASAEGVSGSATISEALVAAGMSSSSPSAIVDDEGTTLSFIGWALEPDAEATVGNDLTIIEADEDDNATYYAVYQEVEAASFRVSFWDEDDTELATIQVTEGSTVAASGQAPDNPSKDGYYFAGWLRNGEKFDLSTDVVTGITNLTASYEPLDASVDDSVVADITEAYVSSDGVERADSVSLNVVAVDDIDANLDSAMGSDPLIQAYSVSLSYAVGSSVTYVRDGFGTVTLTLPVSDSYASNQVMVYWLSADGTVESTDAATPTNGTVTVSFESYDITSFGGNFAVAVEADSTLAGAISNYVSLLAEAFDQYRQGDYTTDGWLVMESTYNSGVSSIRAATSTDAAKSAYEAAIAALAAVEKDTSAELASAKAEALERLANAYASYSSTNYTDENWTALEAAYEAAKSNINSATTASAASSAASNGISAMNAISAGGTTSKTSSTTSGTTLSSSGSSSGTSVSGSTLSSGTSGTSGVTLSSSDSTSGTSLSASLSESLSSAESMLGATLADVTDDLVSEYDLSVDAGVYVESVDEGGAADAAGIQAGDVIVAVDGQEISSLEELEEALAEAEAGDTVEIEVNRDGESLTFTVELDEDTSATSLLGTSLGDADGTSEAEDSSSGGVLDWIQNHIILVCVLGLIVLAAISALIWWLLRRRNRGYEEEDEEEFAEEGSGSTLSSPQPAIQF